MPLFTYFENILTELPVPKDGILSRTLFNDDAVKVVGFAFAQGEELSAHTAPMAAMLYFVSGEAELTLGEEKRTAAAGTWAHMAPRLTHAIRATTPVVMLLFMLKQVR